MNLTTERKYFKTRYPNLVFPNLGKGAWSFFYVDHEGDVRWNHPSQTGPIYASKLELLTHLTRFATVYGLE